MRDSSHMLLRVLLVIGLGHSRRYRVAAEAHVTSKRTKEILKILMDTNLVRDGDSGLFVTGEGARIAMHYLKALEGVGMRPRDRREREMRLKQLLPQ